MQIIFHVDCLSKQTVSHDLSLLLTEFRGRQNCEICKNLDLQFHLYATVCVAQILGYGVANTVTTGHILSSFSFSSRDSTLSYLKFWHFLFSVCPLTSLSWLVIVRRVTGLLGLLLSLTEAMCPFLMIGTVASGWPGVWGCGMVWPCPAEEANLEPSVRYCLTCWFWVWWRWNLEFSRWLCTCSKPNYTQVLLTDSQTICDIRDWTFFPQYWNRAVLSAAAVLMKIRSDST